jgi:hypothetical protein
MPPETKRPSSSHLAGATDGGKLWARAREWSLPLRVFSITYEQGEDMNEFDQQPFRDAEFAENPEQRCPVVLLLARVYRVFSKNTYLIMA